MEKVDRLTAPISNDTSWIPNELLNLRKKTSLLMAIILSILGILIGYYVVGFNEPFSKVVYASVGNNIEIEWKTDIPTMAKVEYGTSPTFLNETQPTSMYKQDHGTLLLGLLPGKSHVFRLVAIDESGQTYTSRFYTVK